MMVDKVFGAAGDRILLEECLIGREASLMLFTDGTGYRAIVPAQDYKRVFDRDQGPNTGGMGSFSTPGLIDEPMHDRICRDIVEPTIEGMRSEGDPFSGILYCGLMLTEAGPQVIEFNCRFGDPETQAVLMRLDDDLVDICDAIVERRIETRPINWSNDSSVCIVAASGGYPGDFEKGKEISGLDYASKREGVVIFHAGTSIDANGALVTSGGRVLGVTARAATLEQARTCAYDAMSLISFKGFNFRTDIGR
jgi:phosphoribosylamine--glycine ligase